MSRDPTRTPIRGAARTAASPPRRRTTVAAGLQRGGNGQRRAQLADPESYLTLYRRLLALRRGEPGAPSGRLPSACGRRALSYRRRAGDERKLVALNLTPADRRGRCRRQHRSCRPALDRDGERVHGRARPASRRGRRGRPRGLIAEKAPTTPLDPPGTRLGGPPRPPAPAQPARRRAAHGDIAMVSPAVILILSGIAFAPVLYTIYLSLHDATVAQNRTTSSGLDNYSAAFRTIRVPRRADEHGDLHRRQRVPLELVIGMGVALVLNRGFRARGLMRARRCSSRTPSRSWCPPRCGG